MLLYFGLLVLAVVALGSPGFGRRTYVIGASSAVARFSGVDVVRNKLAIFMISGFVAALAGVLYARVSVPSGQHRQRLRAGHHHHRAARRRQHLRWLRDDLGVFLSTFLVLEPPQWAGPVERPRPTPRPG